MFKIQKDFGEFPAAHRQPFHSGHCAQIHGHNWRFVAELTSDTLDENGFVFDFGQFAEIKEWLRHNFDHTLLLQENDPHIVLLTETLGKMGIEIARIIVKPSVSCEGLAEEFYDRLCTFLVSQGTASRVSVSKVIVYEDGKNSASYERTI